MVSCSGVSSHSRRTVSSPRSITAKGFIGRALSSRSLATAASFFASQQRWKPPMPLMAAIFPAMTALRTAVMAAAPFSGLSSRYSSGPQSLQQTGWAS